MFQDFSKWFNNRLEGKNKALTSTQTSRRRHREPLLPLHGKRKKVTFVPGLTWTEPSVWCRAAATLPGSARLRTNTPSCC